MIIFGSLLNTFDLSCIFEVAGTVAKIGSCLVTIRLNELFIFKTCLMLIVPSYQSLFILPALSIHDFFLFLFNSKTIAMYPSCSAESEKSEKKKNGHENRKKSPFQLWFVCRHN